MWAKTVFAPAKINLGLRITGRYANGYHRLESVFVPVSLYDRLTITPSARDEIFYDWGAVDAERKRQLSLGAQKNPLLWKSIAFARQLLNHAGIDLPGIRVIVQKRIPSPAGLGGASTDAAALISALLKLFNRGQEPLFDEQMLREVSSLGADIPYFLFAGLEGKPARLEGLGYELSPITLPELRGWLCVPNFGFSTNTMFAEARKMELPTFRNGEAEKTSPPDRNLSLRLIEIPYSDKLAGEVRVAQNDFGGIAASVFPSEHQALRSAMQNMAETVEQFFPGDWLVGMTGSGAGLFAITDMCIAPQVLHRRTDALRARLGENWQVFPIRNHTVETNIGP